MIVGGYELHLYCDFPDPEWEHANTKHGHGHASLSAINERKAMKRARELGWKFTRDRRCICPWCLAQGRKLPAQQGGEVSDA